MFYVYIWYRIEDGNPFYVGKGSNSRYLITNGRNNYFNRIISKNKCRSEIVCKFDNEKDAFDMEVRLISHYKKLGMCEANFTGGGEGQSNISEETKRKISRTLKKNPPRPHLGKKLSLEHRKKISDSHKGKSLSESHKLLLSKKMTPERCHLSKRVICTKSGEIYPTATEAAKAIGMKRRTLSAQLSGQNRNKTTLMYIKEN